MGNFKDPTRADLVVLEKIFFFVVLVVAAAVVFFLKISIWQHKLAT